MPIRPSHADTEAARELALYAQNNGDLYRSRITPIIDNLRRKVAEGTYRADLALKLWRYAADDAAKRYNKEYGHGSAGYGIFTVPTRMETASMLAAYYDDEVREARSNPAQRMTEDQIERYAEQAMNGLDRRYMKGELTEAQYEKAVRELNEKTKRMYAGDTRSNPAKRPSKKTRPVIHRAGLPKSGYVNRPSQITRKAPSKRLKKRRVLAPRRGVFPNPLPPLTYRVDFKTTRGGWKPLGYFPTQAQAVDYAKAINRKHGGQLRVMAPV